MGEVIPFSRQIAREAGGWGFVMPIPVNPERDYHVAQGIEHEPSARRG